MATLTDPTALDAVVTACGLTDDDSVEIHAIGRDGYTIRPATPGFSPAAMTMLRFDDPGPRVVGDPEPAASGIRQSQAILHADACAYPTVIVNLADDSDSRIMSALNTFGTFVTIARHSALSVPGLNQPAVLATARPRARAKLRWFRTNTSSGQPPSAPLPPPAPPKPIGPALPALPDLSHGSASGGRRPGAKQTPSTTQPPPSPTTPPKPAKPALPILGLGIAPGARRPGAKRTR